MTLTRRGMIAGATALIGWRAAMPAIARARAKVVVIGGGVGGVCVVNRLAATGGVDLTLVEPNQTYTTCFYSNLVLGGIQPRHLLDHGYDVVGQQSSVSLAATAAKAVDRERKRVVLADGGTLAYDRLVLSPGISLDYDAVPGWSRDTEERMPHAWVAGRQTDLLKRQLDAVPDGGLIIVIPPPGRYRCPPAPYERVSMMAHALKTTGRHRAKILVLDPKASFSKQALFQHGWERHYPGMIEWMSPMIHAGMKRVDGRTMTVETDFETYSNAALVNVIRAQRAARIALDAGLANSGGYCGVDPVTMRSQSDANIFVLGDAADGGAMPKSAFAASNQAAVVAGTIAHELLDRPAPAAAYRNKCWSLIAADDSVFVSASYRPDAEGIVRVDEEVSSPKDPAAVRRQNYADSAAWYAGLTSEMFAGR